MAIEFACPACQSILSAPAGFEGKLARCKSCGEPVRVPAPSPQSSAIPAPEVPGSMEMTTVAMSAKTQAWQKDKICRFGIQSRLSSVLGFTSLIMLALAVIVQVYVLIHFDSNMLSRMTFDQLVVTTGMSLIPGGSLFLISLLLMSLAHIVEYLAYMKQKA